uniref:Conotoxin ViKr92 n=1 Tax=Conus virgo TaxID=89427 RepID=O16K_CONVR|nr:RecName: Full=Conotoxin ViKr92; Flags: Precursor [Conus virgo]AAZ83774.1 ViKr92P [Conus virgo]
MKLTWMMIVAVLFLTAWTFVTADDTRYKLENPFLKARNELQKLEASQLNERGCLDPGYFCGTPFLGAYCCGGICLIVCIET